MRNENDEDEYEDEDEETMEFGEMNKKKNDPWWGRRRRYGYVYGKK